MHLPDIHLIAYSAETCKAVFLISSKTTLRERVAQTGYWKIKLRQDACTKGLKVFFVTLDEDVDLTLERIRTGPMS